MLRLQPRQRDVLIEKMPDVANLAAGSMFLGQFLTERPFSVVLAVAGVAGWIACWAFTLVLAGEMTDDRNARDVLQHGRVLRHHHAARLARATEGSTVAESSSEKLRGVSSGCADDHLLTTSQKHSARHDPDGHHRRGQQCDHTNPS